MRNWSRDETLLAFELYFRLKYFDIRDTNVEIINLAKIIGRTPQAVKAKLFNIMDLDPNRVKKGLPNNAELVRELWIEYGADKRRINLEMSELKEEYYSGD